MLGLVLPWAFRGSSWALVVSSQKRDFIAELPSNPWYGILWGNCKLDDDTCWTSWLEFLGGGVTITKQEPHPKNQVLNTLTFKARGDTLVQAVCCGLGNITPALIPEIGELFECLSPKELSASSGGLFQGTGTTSIKKSLLVLTWNCVASTNNFQFCLLCEV